jgi:hypothetical protein
MFEKSSNRKASFLKASTVKPQKPNFSKPFGGQA